MFARNVLTDTLTGSPWKGRQQYQCPLALPGFSLCTTPTAGLV